jgi:hypothetical protein
MAGKEGKESRRTPPSHGVADTDEGGRKLEGRRDRETSRRSPSDGAKKATRADQLRKREKGKGRKRTFRTKASQQGSRKGGCFRGSRRSSRRYPCHCISRTRKGAGRSSTRRGWCRDRGRRWCGSSSRRSRELRKQRSVKVGCRKLEKAVRTPPLDLGARTEEDGWELEGG